MNTTITNKTVANGRPSLLRPALISVGAVTTILGAVIWSGRGHSLGGPHMILGLVFVLGVGHLVVRAVRARASRGVAAAAAVSALVLVALGIAQRLHMLGPSHWILQLAHVLTGVATMVATGRLLAAIKTAGAQHTTHTRTCRRHSPSTR